MHLKSTFKNTWNRKHYNNSVTLEAWIVGYIPVQLCLLLPSVALSLVASVNWMNITVWGQDSVPFYRFTFFLNT